MTYLQQFALMFLGQSVLIFAIAALAVRLGRTASARVAIVRYAFLALVGVTLLRALVPGVSNPWIPTVRPAEPSHTVSITPAIPLHQASAVPGSTKAIVTPQAPPQTPTPVPQPADLSWLPTAALAVWLLGVLAVLARMLLGAIWLRELQEGARPIAYSRTEEVVKKAIGRFNLRGVRILESPKISSPLVAGVWTPTIYLPQCQAAEFQPEEIEAMVGHELTHVIHGDNLWSHLAQLMTAICWPNPFAWVIAAKLRAASEELCDSAVLEIGVQPSVYAQCLLRIAERGNLDSIQRTAAIGMFSARGDLARRVSRLFDRDRTQHGYLSRQRKLQLGATVGVAALATCLAIPAVSSEPKHSWSSAVTDSFRPTDHELEVARKSVLPYLSGDFTLIYHVQVRDLRTDEEIQKGNESWLASQRSYLDDQVKKGQITRIDADERLKRTVPNGRQATEGHDITLSCRNGRILYKDSSGSSLLITRYYVYGASATDGTVDQYYYSLNTTYMPLPGVGFAHFPLSLSAVTSTQDTVTVPDVPVYGVMNERKPWEGNLISDLSRYPSTAEFAGSGAGRHMVRLMSPGDGYEYHRFIPLNGIQVAADFTRTFNKREYDYWLGYSSPHALSEEEFQPGYFLKGRQIDTNYEGRRLMFTADPMGSEFRTQLHAQVAKLDHEAAKQNQQQAEWDRIKAMPGGAPDIMPLYKQAREKASREGKNVLAIMTSSICPPCKMLAKFLEDPSVKPIVESHFVVLWIDCGETAAGKRFENVNAYKLCDQINYTTGYPSYAAIDPSGKVLEKQGVGYPDNPEDYDKFFLVLNACPKPLSDAEHRTIVGYLSSHR